MSKVIFISIDAAEPSLVQQWLSDGDLPAIQSILDQGGSRQIGYPDDLVIHPWSNFYTGGNPGLHGVYHYLLWNPSEMKSERYNLGKIGVEPWWRVAAKNLDVIAIDMPMIHRSKNSKAKEVIGWATHETFEPFFTNPPELKSELEKHLGKSMQISERYGLHSEKELLSVREEMFRMIEHTSEMTQYLITEKPWDLFLVAFHSIHLGGHKFWNLNGLREQPSERNRKLFTKTLKEIYQSVDAKIGSILEKVPPDTTIIIGSFHGMGASSSRVPILPDLISRIVSKEHGSAQSKPALGVLSNLRNIIPLPLRHILKKNLPFGLQDRMTSYWRLGGVDWSQTPAFALLSDFDGYVRINLEGREKLGIVSAGSEYNKWMNIVTEGIMSFADKDTGEPIVSRVIRRDTLDLTGPNTDNLPDLFIQWSDTPCAGHRAVISSLYGEIGWHTPRKNPDGRSGNHLRKGILISNKKITAPVESEIAVQDVSATLLAISDLPLPDHMTGKSFH